MPRLNADQAELVLARAREAGLDGEHPLVVAGLARLEAVGGKRRTNAARKWFGVAGDADERRADRANQGGTQKQLRQGYAEYLQDLAGQIEAVNRGGDAVRRLPGDGPPGPKSRTPRLLTVLSSPPDVQRARLSPESLELLGSIGRPLPYDAWRHAYRGATDQVAVESHQRRSAGFFSEYG